MGSDQHGDGTGGAATAAEACESCGDTADDLVLVQRLWVTPEDWDTEGSVNAGDLEWWCFVCRTHYPHQEPTAG